MRKSVLILVLAVTGAIVVGCDGLRGQNSGPDEFGVVTRAPLSMPPDYDLRPPRPGAVRPNETSPRADARSKLLRNMGNRRSANRPEGRPEGNLTGGEEELLKRADALEVDPEIRYIVKRESTRIKEDKTLVDTLVFWRNKTPTKSIVDPTKEAKRLRGNAALGKPVTEGETPILKQPVATKK